MSEDQNTEWKESWRDEYLRWVCAFANSEGGTLVIGRNDKGAVVGLKDSARLLEEIPNKVRDILGIMVAVNLRQEAGTGKEYLEIAVEPYPYPVSYKGEYHVRSGSTKQELKGAALDRFLLRKQGRHWDGVPLPHVAIGDLDSKALAAFRQQALRSQRLSPEVLAESDAVLLEKLHLLEGTYLKRAAVLLFHPEPERLITGAWVKVGFFENNVDLRFQDEVHGNLLAQASEVIAVLKAKYLKASISYEGLQRLETYPVPEAALREAILNAVVHKDYGSGVPIQISVYPDRLMVWNPGQLPAGWTVERLLHKHASQPFNPYLANAFFRAGLIEAWGRGFERILEACRVEGLPEPEVILEETGLWLSFRLKPVKAKTTVETTVKTTVKTPQRILELLAANPNLTLAEVASAIGKSLRAVERASKKLVEEGRLRYVGPKKGGHWEVLEVTI